MLDGREAILGDLDGKSTGLLIEHLGKHILALDWSARSEPGPNGLHFELKVPPCALTLFDLDLPEGRTPALARDGCLLSGPLPGSAPGRKQWRLECAGAAQVDLVIQNASGPGEPRPLLLAHSQTKQSLFLDRVESSFDFTLEVLHGAVREINLICPPQLTPLTVSMRSSTIETWEVRPGAQPGESSILHVRLPEPVQGASLPFHVHGLSPVLPGSLWTCPGLQIAGAINLGETLSLQLAPDVQLGNWHAGDFVLVKAMGDAEGGQTLTFQSGTRQPNVASDPARPLLQRPSAQIGLQDVDFRVRQLAWWQIRPEGASLAAHLGYEVLRGRMYRLVVQLPANWNADRVEITPADLLGNWMVARDNGQDRLIVNLQRPLEAHAGCVEAGLATRPGKRDSGPIRIRRKRRGILRFPPARSRGHFSVERGVSNQRRRTVSTCGFSLPAVRRVYRTGRSIRVQMEWRAKTKSFRLIDNHSSLLTCPRHGAMEPPATTTPFGTSLSPVS